MFRMRRGGLLVVVNFGDSAVSVSVGQDADLLFVSGDDVVVDQDALLLPAHAGALVAGAPAPV
jgi:hypothetical protein